MRVLIQRWFLIYLHILGRLQLMKNPKARVIGITGSSGKGSTREAVYAGMRDYVKIKHCSKGNSETGIPMDILGLEIRDYSMRDWIRIGMLSVWKLLTNWERYEVLLLEMGIDSNVAPKDMGTLLKIVQPEVGVFLNVSSVHVGNFITQGAVDENQAMDLIAQEKGKMIEGLPANGFAILNTDDERVRQFSKKTKAEVISFGKQGNIKIISTKSSVQEGFEVIFEIDGKKYALGVKGEVFGPQFGYTFGAAIAVGLAVGIAPENVIEGIKKYYQVIPGRGKLLRGKKGSWIIDSSYNASKLAVLDAIGLCKHLSAPKKVAVLGDLREIGDLGEETHKGVFREAVKVFDEIVLVGEQFEKYVKPAEHVAVFRRANEAVGYMEELLGNDVVVLVKGGQNTIYLEYVVERILENAADNKYLTRRGVFWEKVRRSFFS